MTWDSPGRDRPERWDGEPWGTLKNAHLTWSIPLYGVRTDTAGRIGRGRGSHFADMLFMGPLAAVAILALRQMHLVAPTPIWLIPLILVGGQLADHRGWFWWDRSHAAFGSTSSSHRK